MLNDYKLLILNKNKKISISESTVSQSLLFIFLLGCFSQHAVAVDAANAAVESATQAYETPKVRVNGYAYPLKRVEVADDNLTKAYVASTTYVYNAPERGIHKMGKLFSYAPIRIVKHMNDTWTRVKMDNHDTGYILREHITLREPTMTPNYKQRKIYMSGAGIKVRKYPSTENSPVKCMTLMGHNVSVSYLPTSPISWVKVDNACPFQWKVSGFVQRRFVSQDAPNIPQLFKKVDDVSLSTEKRTLYAERALEAAYSYERYGSNPYILPALNRLFDLVKTDSSKASDIQDTLFRINTLLDVRSQTEREQFIKENPIKLVVKNMPTKKQGYGYAWADVQKKLGAPDSLKAISNSDGCDFSAKHYVASYPFAEFYLNADKTEARVASMDMVDGNYVMLNGKRYDMLTREFSFLDAMQGHVSGDMREQAREDRRSYDVADMQWATNEFIFEDRYLAGIRRLICMG